MTEALDDIRRQVMWTRLLALVEEQARTLMATAFSPVVREAGDLSAGIFDTRGRMMAQAVTGTPGHVNSMAEAVIHFLAKHPPGTMKPGDHFISNDPWQGSGHLHDITVVSPAFLEGRIVALFACTCHQVDIGGLGQVPDGHSVYEEGLYIPILHLARGGIINQDLMEMISWIVRSPDEVEGDILSYVTSTETAAAQLVLMMREFGLADLDALADTIIERSRAATEAAIAALPNGTFRNRLRLDGFGQAIELVCSLTIEDRHVLIDYTGSSPASANGINVVLNYCKAYSAFGVRCVVAPEVPNNAGSLAPIVITAPEDCIVNATRPKPVSARHIIGQFLPDVVMGCLAQALPGQVPAEGAACLWGVQLRGGPEVSAVVGHAGGETPERYEILFFNSGGSGGRPALDGMNATAFPSGVRAMSSEIVETRAPVVVWKKELRPDSAGPGEHRGGLGQSIEIGSSGAPFAISAMFDRVDNPARGRDGGGDGAAGAVGLASGKPLAAKGIQYIAGDDRVRLELPGGGGFGDALARDPGRLADDVADQLISPAAAGRDYGKPKP